MLTDIKIRAARPEEKPYKVYDSRGLYFYITPKGTKSWRFDYKINNKRKTATLGTYPEVSLAEARLKRDELRIQLSKGMIEEKKKNVLFRDVALRWLESKTYLTPGHIETLRYRLNAYVLSVISSAVLS